MLSKKSLTIFLSWILCSLPITLLTGPFLPDLSISIIGIIFLYIVISNKDFQYLNNTFSKIFFIFCFYLIINSIFSDFSYFSLKSSLFYFRFGVFSLAIWYLLNNQKDLLNNFLIFLIIGFFIGLAAGTYQYIYSETIFGLPNPSKVHFRLLLLTSDNAILGQYFSRLLPLLIGLLILKKRFVKIHYFLFFLLFVSTDLIIFISGERTALGLLVISSTFIIIFMKRLRLFRLITIACSIILILIISMYSPKIKERHIDYTLNQLGLNEKSEKIYLFSKDHENFIFTSWNMFNDNLIVGVGPNNYRKMCGEIDYGLNEFSCSTHPHNNYIQILSELGIFGFIFLLLAVFYLIKTVLHDFYHYHKNNISYLSDYQICLISCFVCNLWPFFPTLNLFNGWINIIYFLPIGFYLHSIYINGSPSNK